MLSVDFTGGTLLSYSFNERIPVAELEGTLQAHAMPAKVTYKSSASQSDNRKVEILLREGFEKKFSAGKSGIGEHIQTLLNQKYPELKLKDAPSGI